MVIEMNKKLKRRIDALERKVNMLLVHSHGVGGNQTSPPVMYQLRGKSEYNISDYCVVCGKEITYENKETDKQILGNRNKKKKPLKMRETMIMPKMLEQIREEKKMKVGIPLTDKEQDECVKEWIQEHKKELLKKYNKNPTNNLCYRINHCNELLVELED